MAENVVPTDVVGQEEKLRWRVRGGGNMRAATKNAGNCQIAFSVLAHFPFPFSLSLFLHAVQLITDGLWPSYRTVGTHQLR